MSRTASEFRFERYLTENSYDFEHEPNWGVGKRADYAISRRGLEAACEVKEFTTTVISDRLHAMGGTAMLSHKEVFGAVRSQLDAAARQLKPLAGRGLPLVVVLANPHHADVSLDPEDVLAAMYGNPAFSIPIGPEGARGEDRFFLDRDGALTAKHLYLSAVVTLHERGLDQDWADREVKRFDEAVAFLRWANAKRAAGCVPEGTRRYAHVFHTVAAATGEATPLPDTFFDARDDAVWSPIEGAYVQTRGAPRE